MGLAINFIMSFRVVAQPFVMQHIGNLGCQVIMIKILTFLVYFAFAQSCFAQFDKQVVARATANFNIVLDGLGTNDAGVGLGLDISFFSKRKLQLVLEGSGDWFIGDKLGIADSLGEYIHTKSARAYSLRLGPQYFINKNIAVSVTYGPAWYVFRATEYVTDHSFRYSIIGFWGKRRHFTTKVFLSQIGTRRPNVSYLGIAAGMRF
jgi:hypothetical protein